MEQERIEEKLDAAIAKALEDLDSLPAGSPEKLKATVAATNLYKARDARYRADSEYTATIDAKDKELKQRERELLAEKAENGRNRLVQIGTTIGTLLFWATQFTKSLKFEETGIMTNSVSKTLQKLIRF